MRDGWGKTAIVLGMMFGWCLMGPGVVLGQEFDRYQLIWGDVHGHTTESDGAKDLDGYFDYAKNVSGLDFVAVTDHVRYMDDDVGGDSEVKLNERWQRTIEVTNQWNGSGLVTLLGWEWLSDYDDPTGSKGYKNEGHKNVYFLRGNGDLPILTSKTVEVLVNDMKAIDSSNYLLIPHSVNSYHPRAQKAFTDWNLKGNLATKEKQTLVEIYSKWGSGEWPGWELSRPSGFHIDGSSVQNALAKGYKMGFLGSSDTHLSMPGSVGVDERKKFPGILKRDQWISQNRGPCQPVAGKPEYCVAIGDWEAKFDCPVGTADTVVEYCNKETNKWVYRDYPDSLDFSDSGITGAYVDSKNREGLFGAMTTKRVFATSGSRTRVEFSIGGHLMGEEYTEPGVPKIKFRVVAEQGKTIDYVEIIKGSEGGSLPFLGLGGQRWCQGQINCVISTEDGGFVGDSFYYLRTKDSAGKMAWSSPIWIKKGMALPTSTPGVIISAVLQSPKNLIGTCSSSSGPVTITWADAGNEDFYYLSRKVNGGEWNYEYKRVDKDKTLVSDEDSGVDKYNNVYDYNIKSCRGGVKCPDLAYGNQIGVVCVPGDANGDKKVDFLDLRVWKTEYLNKSGLTADFNNDKKVDLLDLKEWKVGYLLTK